MSTSASGPILKRRCNCFGSSGLRRPATFSEHWRTVHGPLAARLPEFWKYNTRYVQNHPLEVSEPPWDGIAQTDQRPRADMRDSLYAEPVFMQVIRPDELTFLDIERSMVIFGARRVIKDGPTGGMKILALLREPTGWSLERFHDHWLNVHAPLVRSVPRFWNRVTRYVQHHVIPDLSRSLAAADGRLDVFAGVGEIFFDSAEAADEALKDDDYRALIRPDERLFAGPGSMRLRVAEYEITGY